MKRFFWNLIACGLPHNHDLEELRRIIMINLITLLGASFILPMGILAYIQGNTLLGTTDTAMLVLLAFLLLYLRRTLQIERMALFGAGLVAVFFLFLVATGGTGRTAHLWTSTFPLISFFLLGHIRGLVFTAGFLLLTAGLIVCGGRIPLTVAYEPDLILRILMVYITVTAFSYVMERVRSVFQARLTRANRSLKEKIDEIETLRGILPICANCKKIRDDKGYWHQVETYIHDRSMADFTHGICPQCKEELYPELYRKKTGTTAE